MHVQWQLCNWGSLFLMLLMELIHTASENHLVFVLAFVPLTFLQWSLYGYACLSQKFSLSRLCGSFSFNITCIKYWLLLVLTLLMYL